MAPQIKLRCEENNITVCIGGELPAVHLPRAQKIYCSWLNGVSLKIDSVSAGATGKQQHDVEIMLVRLLYKLMFLKMVCEIIKIKVLLASGLRVEILYTENGQMFAWHAWLAVRRLIYNTAGQLQDKV